MDIRISLDDLLNKKGGNNEMNNRYIDKVVKDFLSVKIGDLRPGIDDEGNVELVADFVEFLTGDRNHFNTSYLKATEWLNSDALNFVLNVKCLKNIETFLFMSSIGAFYKQHVKRGKKEIINFLNLNVSEYVQYVSGLPGWKKEWYGGNISELVKWFEGKLKKDYRVHDVLLKAFENYDDSLPPLLVLNDASEKMKIIDEKSHKTKHIETCVTLTLIWILMVYGPLAVYESSFTN